MLKHATTAGPYPDQTRFFSQESGNLRRTCNLQELGSRLPANLQTLLLWSYSSWIMRVVQMLQDWYGALTSNACRSGSGDSSTPMCRRQYYKGDIKAMA